MDNRATECEIMELENKDPTAEPVSLPLGFLRSITDDFCNKQKLGEGAYGVVYKGILPCGSVIAIKKLNGIFPAVNDQSFKNEASCLMDIKHQNVVQLLGFCTESRGAMMLKQENGKVFVAEEQTMILCFEYICKGSLDKHLSDESSSLELNTRYKIIKGICHGLNFLHGCNIIHLDLKPENILMGDTMTPKIADFGLSRLLGEQKSYTVAGPSSRHGTPGYMAPEYIDRGIISKKADIFSLGVIIIQILTGSKDYPNYLLHTKIDFQHFTENVLSKWSRIFEGSSKYTSPELHIQLVRECINIALGCVYPDKEKRPDVSNIIESLNAIEKKFYDQNGEDLLVDYQMGTQEGLLTSTVLREDGLVASNKNALNDHAQAWITKSMMKSAVALPQPQHETVLERADGSLVALRYQGARNATFWVVHKALASLEDNVLKDWAATINLGPSVEALERELMSVKVILTVTLAKVINNLALEDILIVLRELVYDAEDVLDEMEYFRIQGDVLDASRHADGCAHNQDLNVSPSVQDEPPKLRFDRNNASKRIEHIVKQMQLVRQQVSSSITLLGSDWSTAPNIAQSRPITTSESIEPKLYGRESITKRIIDDITKGKHSGEVLTVIPIVGPGGIGKTTLAQHIYHSGEVQEHFDVRVWTCVSLNFNVNKLTEEIQRHIPKVDGERSTSTTSELIGQRLKNKRLFLVLDDIWDCSDEDEWKRLLVPFRKSKVQGNIIIVTTRFPAQAQIMVQKNDQSINLRGLENKEFEELFLEIIFGDDDQSRKDHTFLLEIGFRVARKLKGSPLAAKTVGRLLKTQLDLVHWTRILETKEWEKINSKNGIMPALKLSFDYLPCHLQQCFSYFALFPQDYKFEKEGLINFWIGQEVLHFAHGENKRVEDIGLSHLTELVNYGLLENTGVKDGRTYYILHDLLHELALQVSSLECLLIDNSQSLVSSLQVQTSIRHLSIKVDGTSAKDRFSIKKSAEDFYILSTRLKVEKLRTLMIFGVHHGCFLKVFGDLFREAKALRLVFLSGASYDVKDLFHNFYYLIHLRYLRIGSSSLYTARFSNKISRFYHMKILDAKSCNIVDDLLPRDMRNLVKLRHFLVQNDALHSRIFGVGKLKSLQELRRFVVKQDNQGFELRQIGDLDLCGSLSIYNLQNVRVKEEADEAKLLLKSRLRELKLNWDNIDRSTNDSTLEEHVLERLMPSSNLLKLSVRGHRGATCPSWLGTNISIKSLESLCLDGVAWATFPPIGELLLVTMPHDEISGNIPKERFGNLRRLELYNLTMVEKWVVHAPCQLFPFLEVLVIKDCPQLVHLAFQHFSCCQQAQEVNVCLFPRLEKLVIRNCRQLSSFPPIPWNKAPFSINIEGISRSCLHKLNSAKIFKSEYGLPIDNVYGLTIDTINGWNLLNFHNLTELKELKLNNCGSPPLCNLQMLSSLRILQMSCSSNVFPFTEADSLVKYQFPVEELFIEKWNASGKDLTQLLTYFPKLSDLKLKNCLKVTGIGVNVMGQRATETPGLSSSSSANKVRNWGRERRRAERGMLLLPPQLQRLDIRESPELKLRSKPHDDNNKDGGTGGGRGGLQALTSLRGVEICSCPKLLSNYSSSSFSSSFPFPNSMKYLHIWGTTGMDTLVPLLNLTSLTSLFILGCRDLRGEGLLPVLGQDHLTLALMGTPNFFVDFDPSNVHEQEIPSCSSKLQDLSIDDVAGFTAAAIRCSLLFSSLTRLEIYGIGDDKVERFTEEQEALLFVDSLKDVIFLKCKMQYLPKRLHGHRNLKRLCIWDCDTIQMLPKDVLPSSLEELDISSCPKIQSLPKDCLPDSLQKLKIHGCPAIRSLPEVDDLPSSLRELDVSSLDNCVELRWQCRKLINIIPIVRVSIYSHAFHSIHQTGEYV